MSEQSYEKFSFTGNAKEWFGIWIVNLLLSIVTLGIYSAWAKVRREKYFKNNTYVSNRNFDYHATGKQILIGRLIVVGAYILFNILLIASPIIGLIVLAVLICFMPWLIVRSMMFNARMTSFSNVRFNFVGTAGRAFLVLFIYPIVTILTLYTTAPFASRALQKFCINNHRLGTAEFHFDSGIGPFYKAFLAAIAWVIIAGGLAVVVTDFSIIEFSYAMENIENDPTAAVSIIGLFYLLIFVALLPAVIIYYVMIRNTIYNIATLDGTHKFNSTVSVGKMLWLTASNFVVVIGTLGLMLPWAQVRIVKYLAANTDLIPGDSLDNFIGTQQSETSALGDAFTDIESIDVGLPL